jgi:hypothetical protein
VAASGRVLLVAYYVPPAGGPAVQRILQFIEHLGEAGWTPEVMTVRAGAYPNRDASLRAEIPEEVRVHRTPSLDPLAVYQALRGGGEDALPAGSMGEDEPSWLEWVARWVRANIFIPDARVGWWPFAVWTGRRLLRSGRFDAVLTSGAPHSVHLIGRSLHRRDGTPWVADLHDPWTDISYYDDFPRTRWARRRDAALERSVLAEADAVTTVSPSWADLFAGKAVNRYAVVENGIDLRDVARGDGSVDEATFTLAHVGKLYASRNPTVLWRALASLRGAGRIPDLRVRLTGSVDPAVRRSIEAHDLAPIVEVEPFVPHEEALRRMASSTLLLLVIESFAQADGMITSKLYEYLASGRPVLGVGPPDGDAQALLNRHEAGMMAGRDDVERVREIVISHYEAWAGGTPKAGAARAALAPHSRREQARRMAEVLGAVVDPSV